MSQVPGLGHVTFYRHPGRCPTLFHSPLVGLDEEPLTTSTLREKLEEEMNFQKTWETYFLALALALQTTFRRG